MATVSTLVEAFLNQVTEERAAATALHYRKRLKPFLKKFADRNFSELTPLDIRSYLTEVNRFAPGHKRGGEQKAAATRASNAIVLVLLEHCAIELKEIPGPIFPKFEIPIGAQREELPTEAEVKKILNRARPAFALIYRALRQTGARPNELVKATFADWHRDENMIVLEKHKTANKTGKKRKIVVGKRFLAILVESTRDRTEGHLFLNCVGKPWTVDALSKTFSRLRDAAGVRSSIVLYCTRHEHATRLCEKVGIDDAADALGHGSINTTRRYVHKDQKRLQANQDLMDDLEADKKAA